MLYAIRGNNINNNSVFVAEAPRAADQRETGHVLVLGQGDVGQLGLGEDIMERKKPALVKGLDDLEIVQVECGGMHTVALTNNGKVMSCRKIYQQCYHRPGFYVFSFFMFI